MPVGLPEHPLGSQSQGHPKQGKQGADLPQNIAPLLAVVPDAEVPVGSEPHRQLHRGNDSGPCKHPQEGRPLGLASVQLPNEHKAEPSSQKHTAVAAATPQQLQTHIQAASQQKQGTAFAKFHIHHLSESIAKNTLKKTGENT